MGGEEVAEHHAPARAHERATPEAQSCPLRPARPTTAWSFAIFPRPQEADDDLFLKKGPPRWGVGHAAPVAPAAPAAEATTPGTVIPPSSPLVTQAPPHTPRPDPAGRRRLSTDRQPLLSQEVCSLLVSILGAWTQPWNFTSLEETGQPGLGILLSPCRPSPCHPCPPHPQDRRADAP